ncbi:hypothetical protein HYT01_04115 [Candidatus Giovannonibacteria bacterium]|nr:hypothetical protein [Candidatus Giovannonibacteria bacterium]
MEDSITKKDLEQYQKSIIDALDFSLRQMEQRMDEKYSKEETLRKLMITLDNFLKQMSDHKEEFIILKSEVDKIKSFIKEKFGVEIAVQG